MRRMPSLHTEFKVLALTAPTSPDQVAPGIDYRLVSTVTDLVVTGGDAAGRHAVLVGNALDNTMTGSLADETILGLGGNDTLVGGGGRDILNGGKGNSWVRLEGFPKAEQVLHALNQQIGG